MTQIMRKFEFDAGHRIVGHESKCKNLHGHRYVAEVYVDGTLDKLGRVIDYGTIKNIIGHWIDTNWDHNFLLNSQDQLIRESAKQTIEAPEHYLQRIIGCQPYIFQDKNPTAENIAEELFVRAKKLFVRELISVTTVRIWETPGCNATYTLDDYIRDYVGFTGTETKLTRQ